MIDYLYLREELRGAARLCGLAKRGDGQLPPIIFHYVARDSAHRGHLSTPWAFSLCKSGKMFSAEETAIRIAAANPNWEAEKGYINITLTQYQLNKVINELAAAFNPCQYALVRPDDSSEKFLMEYFIYLAVQQESMQTEQRVPVESYNYAVQNDPRPAIVYAALGGSCDLLAQEMYRYYKHNYCMGTDPCTQAAAEIFAKRLYKIK